MYTKPTREQNKARENLKELESYIEELEDQIIDLNDQLDNMETEF